MFEPGSRQLLGALLSGFFPRTPGRPRAVAGLQAVLLLGVFLFPAAGHTAPPGFIGTGELAVNSFTTDDQFEPALSVAPDGRFVVVWSNHAVVGYDFADPEILARRFDSQGAPQAVEFRVNTTTYGRQASASHGPDGSFVVVWAEGSFNPEVLAQRYDASGSTIGGELQVNFFTEYDQERPRVSHGPGGEFVVVWESGTSDQNEYGVSYAPWDIAAQLFDAAGSPVAGEFLVNTYTTSYQRDPAISHAPDGTFVVVWSSLDQVPEQWVIQAQRFSSSGAPLAEEFQVSSYTFGRMRYPEVSHAPDGAFVVAWTSSHAQDGNQESVWAQRFASQGTRIGGEVQVNSYTPYGQKEPSLSHADDGSWIATWSSKGVDGSGSAALGQRFAAGGERIGGEFQWNTTTMGDQSQATIRHGPGGAFVVVWTGEGPTPGPDTDIMAEAFVPEPLLMLDGFETGDTSCWGP